MSHRLFRSLRILACLLCVTAGANFALAAPPAAPADAATDSNLPAALSDTVNAAIAALARKRDLSTEQRKQAEDLLRDALNDDQRASDEVTRMQTLRDAGAQARDIAQRGTAAPKEPGLAFADWRSKLPQDASSERLSDLLEQERNQLGAAQDALRTLEETLQKQTQRPDALRDELAAARDEFAKGLAATPTPSASASLAAAAALRAQAAQRLQRAHLAALETEQRTFEARLSALFAQRSERRHDVDEHSQRVHLLENMLLDRANASVGDLATRLTQERDELSASHAAPILIDAANSNLELGSDLVATVKRAGALRDVKNAYTSERAEIEQALKSTQARIELGTLSEDVGALLLAERRKLRPAAVLERELASLRNELAQTKLGLLDLREQQDSLENLDSAIATTLTRAGQLPVLSGDLHDGLRHLLATRSDVLTRLISVKSRTAQLLADSEHQLAELTRTTTTLSNLLDAHLLGTPSHAPINTAWFGDFARAAGSAAHIDVRAVGTDLIAQLKRSGPLLPLLAFALLLGGVAIQRRAPAVLELAAAPLRRIRTDRYRYTLQTLVWTVVAAAPVAALWAVAGRIFGQTTRGAPLEGALGLAAASIALPWFAIALLHWLNREMGLAHLHFRWPRARREALLATVWPLAFAVILPLFVGTWLRAAASEEVDATIGRALFMLGAFGLAAITWRALRPDAVWTQRGVVQVEPLRLRQIVRVGLAGLFIALAIAAAAGYLFTAANLARHVLMSLAALLAIGMLHGLAVRWLMLGERRLALKRAEERRNAQLEARDVDEQAGESLPEAEVDEQALADLGAQTRRVLRLATWLLLGAALLVIWSDIAPALSFLDQVTVWKSTYADTEGKQIAFDVTLRAVLESMLILGITFAATRNLPGLLEIGMLRRIHLDAPTRYAITSIVRYLIVLVGVLSGVGLLGVHWSNLQWLAAGLTVGLGFGLQEIFANFISGLIVLFERPCRVGDIITIGGVEGTVMRIRTRATTILDWDNREVIVPNKNFITERLVNWTLSDTITRIVIRVGVAYRADARRAQQLLFDCATKNELVLADPAPTAWVTAFGDSKQELELRVFVAEINQRNLVRTDLQVAIAETLRAHGIEMMLLAPIPNDPTATNQPAPSADASSASNRA
jgi:potassium efflux system protein